MPASVSSLLSAAASRRNKIAEQQDQLIAFEYSLSDKTADDFNTYQKYLTDRVSSTDDISKNLSYQKAIVAARKGYFSNEIQRQNINIIEGRGDNNTKYGKMVELYYQAVDNGDYDLAQTLNLQLDNLSVKIQQENTAKQESAQRVAKSMADNGVKDLKALVKKIKDSDTEVLVNGQPVAGIKQINNELRGGNAKDYFAALFDTSKAIQELVGNAYNAATDQDTVDKLESTFKDVIEGTAKYATVTGNDGKTKNLSMRDIELGYRSAAANNPIYSLESRLDAATGQQTFNLKENKIDDFAWTRNDDGTYQATQLRASNKPAFQDLDTQVTDEGFVIGDKGQLGDGRTANRNGGLTIRNRLQSAGIVVQKQNSDGTIDVIIPGVGQTQGTIMPDGSLRYFGPQGNYSGDNAGLYEINTLTGNSREVAPDEASDFGNESVFGGLVSQPSERGRNYITGLFGLNSPVNDIKPVDLRNAKLEGMGRPALSGNGPINTANDFSGRGRAVTSSLLQGASFTQGNVLKEQAERVRQAAMAENARLQAAATLNLNQMPVAQFASNGAPIRQLTVAKPAYQAPIKVAPPPTTTQQKAQSLVRYAVPAGNLLQGFR